MQIFSIGVLVGMALDMLISLYCSNKKSSQIKSSGDYSWLVKEAITLREECNELKIRNVELECELKKR